MKLVTLLPLAISLGAFQVYAETAYRGVDAQGNVSFSDKSSDMAKGEKISIDAPAPSAEAQREAQQRSAEMQKAASQTGNSDAAAKASQQKADRQAVKDAEKQYEEAIQVGEGDRIGTAGGGSRLTPEYQQRVGEAEAQLEQAKKSGKGVK